MDFEIDFNFNLLDCMYAIQNAWQLESEGIIRNCWKIANIFMIDISNEYYLKILDLSNIFN